MAEDWARYNEDIAAWNTQCREFFRNQPADYDMMQGFIALHPPPSRPTTAPPTPSYTPTGMTPNASRPPSVDPSPSNTPRGDAHQARGGRAKLRVRTAAISRDSNDLAGPSHAGSPSKVTTPTPRSRRSGKGRGCCGGSDDVDEAAHVVSPPPIQSSPQVESAQSNNVFYSVDARGGLVMDRRGQEVRRFIYSLVHTHVRSVYEPKSYRPQIIDRIIEAINDRYPQIGGRQLDETWLRRRIISHIANRRSAFTRKAREVLRREREGLPQLKNKGIPKNCHKKEWQEALKRGVAGQSAQHVAARKV